METNKPNIFYINRSEIDERLDPIFYNSVYKKCLQNPKYTKLSNVCVYFKSGIGAGKQYQTSENDGIIQIRPTNIDSDGLLKFDKNVYIPIDKKNLVEPNTVLFNNTNSQELVGKTGFFEGNETLSYSNHITVIKADDSKIIPKFLWVILNIYQRQQIFYSICTNWNNQSGVGIDLLKSIKIPLPTKDIQQIIVDKINQAYQLKQEKEKEAKRLLDSIDDYLLGELGITLPEIDNSLENRVFISSFSEVTENRLDSYYHQKYFKEAFECLNKTSYNVVSLKNISNVITSGITPKSGGDDYTTQEEGIAFVRSGNININGDLIFDDLLYLKPDIHYKTMKSSQLKYGDLMIAIVGATIGQVGIYLDDLEANINQAIALVRLKDGINRQYVKELIKSSIGQLNLNRLKRPVARANINLEEISTMQLILPPIEKQNEIAEHISKIRDEAKRLQLEAKEILEKAKLEVEQIILGE